jgi:hypothetical protein
MASVPTYKINSQQVEDAWQAYRALQLAACENTALLENKYFLALQDTAYARFLMTFEAMEV